VIASSGITAGDERQEARDGGVTRAGQLARVGAELGL
jgi:hypothetical protein